MATRRYGAKQRVVTATKPMRFETFYGTRNTIEREQHHEEREAKRWLKTRLDRAAAHTSVYDAATATKIADILMTIRGRDMMAMKPDTEASWEYTYSGMHITCGVRRLP